MAHGTIVQLPGTDNLFQRVASHSELTLNHINHLAVAAVQVCAGRSLRLEHIAHDFHPVVGKAGHVELALSTLEAIDGLHRYFIEINHHNILSVFEFVGAKVIKKCGVG